MSGAYEASFAAGRLDHGDEFSETKGSAPNLLQELADKKPTLANTRGVRRPRSFHSHVLEHLVRTRLSVLSRKTPLESPIGRSLGGSR